MIDKGVICMSKQPKGSAALKHGGYSGLTLLPCEDRLAFEKLRRELFAELRPQGRLEEEIVTDVARLTWRKQNLGKYELTQLLRIFEDVLITSCRVIGAKTDTEEFVKSADIYTDILEMKDQLKTQEQSASEAETEKLLKQYDLCKMATLEGLMREWEVEERLGAMIDKCLKRLLFVRGLKSLDRSAEVASSPVRLASSRRAS
jgi:hypothetical protein